MEQIKKILTAVSVTEGSLLAQLLSDPIKRLTQFSDVELTEAEIAEALIQAKSGKSIQLENKKREMERRKSNDLLFKPFEKGELLLYCLDFYNTRFYRSFLIDEHNKILVKALAQYFTGDAAFEKGSYSLKKGILIMGSVGVGKTEIMRLFQKNKKCCYAIKSCNEVADEFSTYKGEIASVYSTPIEKALNDPSVFFQRKIGYCFDDLGTEDVKNDFGNKKNVMADVLMAIYDKKEYHRFHITTNLSAEEIEPRYGSRVKSRLREMFNVFELPGIDRRI